MSTYAYGTKYNPTDPQIKTWSVQRTLDPLVAQVCYDFKYSSLINVLLCAIKRRL